MTIVGNDGAQMYPAILKLRGRTCLVVGGGVVALHKAQELLRCGALVHAVAPEWDASWEAAGDEQTSAPRATRSTRAFEPADLAGIFLAVAATDDRAVQEQVASLAEQAGVLVNVVDVPDLCSFFVPASVRRGSLIVSVSTEGKSPSFAVAVRDRIARGLAPEIGAGLERLAEARDLVKNRYPRDQKLRSAALRRLASSPAVDGLMQGRLTAFEAYWNSWKESL